jgi:hypothetical protein
VKLHRNAKTTPHMRARALHTVLMDVEPSRKCQRPEGHSQGHQRDTALRLSGCVRAKHRRDRRNVKGTFVEGLRQRLPKRTPTQKQYREQDQNQDQKPSALRAGWRKEHAHEPTNGIQSEVPAHLVATAKETLS